MSRAIRNTGRLSKAADTMGYVPRLTGTHAESIRTCNIEIEGQEASWASKMDQETSRAIWSARAMEMAMRGVGNEAERMVQQAAHAVTRNGLILVH